MNDYTCIIKSVLCGILVRFLLVEPLHSWRNTGILASSYLFEASSTNCFCLLQSISIYFKSSAWSSRCEIFQIYFTHILLKFVYLYQYIGKNLTWWSSESEAHIWSNFASIFTMFVLVSSKRESSGRIDKFLNLTFLPIHSYFM